MVATVVVTVVVGVRVMVVATVVVTAVVGVRVMEVVEMTGMRVMAVVTIEVVEATGMGETEMVAMQVVEATGLGSVSVSDIGSAFYRFGKTNGSVGFGSSRVWSLVVSRQVKGSKSLRMYSCAAAATAAAALYSIGRILGPTTTVLFGSYTMEAFIYKMKFRIRQFQVGTPYQASTNQWKATLVKGRLQVVVEISTHSASSRARTSLLHGVRLVRVVLGGFGCSHANL